MSDLISAIILAIIQGATEWFPVSSSGHLVLFESILGYEGGLLFDVALHFGTLMAVFVYFGKDITDIIRDFVLGKWHTENGRMAIYLIIGTIPALIIGLLIKDFFDTLLANLLVVSFGFGISGLILLISSFSFNNSVRNIRNLGYGKSFLIGIAQALAIVPGLSRSGATISSGVFLGLNEKNAMKFAFLLSIPVILGANIIAVGNNSIPAEMIWATLISFIVGLLSIHFVFRYVLVKRKNFRWFGVYCLLLALAIGIWLMVY